MSSLSAQIHFFLSQVVVYIKYTQPNSMFGLFLFLQKEASSSSMFQIVHTNSYISSDYLDCLLKYTHFFFSNVHRSERCLFFSLPSKKTTERLYSNKKCRQMSLMTGTVGPLFSPRTAQIYSIPFESWLVSKASERTWMFSSASAFQGYIRFRHVSNRMPTHSMSRDCCFSLLKYLKCSQYLTNHGLHQKPQRPWAMFSSASAFWIYFGSYAQDSFFSLLKYFKYTQYLSNHGLHQKLHFKDTCSLPPLPFGNIFGSGMF